MIIVERIVPPRAVLFLQREQDGGEAFRIGGALVLGQEIHRAGEIEDAVIIEVTGDLEGRLMGNGALAAVAEKSLAGEEAVRPGGEDLVGDGFLAEDAEAGVAGLRAGERTCGPVDVSARGCIRWGNE
jgi:hypothetical protein